jgi:AAA domain
LRKLAPLRTCSRLSAEQSCSVLVIDSISHVWMELVEAYMKKKGRDRLAIWGWNPIKTEWRQFTDLYLCSKLHIVLCGRAAFTYDEWLNEKGEKESSRLEPR